jgi:hypothetical protein
MFGKECIGFSGEDHDSESVPHCRQ